MKDKIVFPNIITDIFLFFLKQEPSPLWLTEGSVDGVTAQPRSGICSLLFIKASLSPILPDCALYPLE